MANKNNNQLELRFELEVPHFPTRAESPAVEPPKWLGEDGMSENPFCAVAGTKRVDVGKHLETPCFHGRERSW